MHVLFVGHSTFLLETTDGQAMLTDPWFAPRGLWRTVPAARCGDEIGRVDLLLASHNHLDHLDRTGLDLARRWGATVVGSRRVARRARRHGCPQAVGLGPGERFASEGLTIVATHAQHPLAGLFGDRLPIGFLIETDDLRLFYSGDTRLHAALLDQLHQAGPIDVMFLQIACAWYLTDDGMRVGTAAQLAQALRPALTIPMHYHARGKQADPRALVRALEPYGLAVKVFAPGERYELRGGNAS